MRAHFTHRQLFALELAALLWVGCRSDADSATQPSPPGQSARAELELKPSPPEPSRAVPPPSEGTRVVLLGTGTPVPTPARSGPATAIVFDGKAYLVDAGPGVVRRAVEAHDLGVPELEVTNLTHLFLTHLHSDHTAGYPDLILTPAVVGRRGPLEVFGPKGVGSMTRHLLSAYAQDFVVRHQGKSTTDVRGYGVEPHEIEAGVVYQTADLKVTAYAVPHGSFAPNAFAYRFDTPGRSIVLSGDTAPSEEIVRACAGCDIMVHEVYCEAGLRAGADQGNPGFARYHQGFHTSGLELAGLMQRAKPKLLVLSHLLLFGCTEAQLLQEVRSEYAGEVVVGEDLGVY